MSAFFVCPCCLKEMSPATSKFECADCHCCFCSENCSKKHLHQREPVMIYQHKKLPTEHCYACQEPNPATPECSNCSTLVCESCFDSHECCSNCCRFIGIANRGYTKCNGCQKVLCESCDPCCVDCAKFICANCDQYCDDCENYVCDHCNGKHKH